MKIGVIKHIDLNNKQIRVHIKGVFADNIPNNKYPIALVSTPFPNNNTQGFYRKLYVGQLVLIDFLNNDYNKPIIVNFIHSEDTEGQLFNKNSISIVNNETEFGFNLIENENNKNIDIKHDGNVYYNLTTNEYKNLLNHLKDITTKLNDIIDKYNNHIHDLITAQGVKGKTLKFGVNSNIPDGESLPELNEALVRANASGVGIDPITGWTIATITAKIANTTTLITQELSTQSGEIIEKSGGYLDEFKSKS